MNPALSIYDPETARDADPYSLQHTGTYTRASPEPGGLLAARPGGLDSDCANKDKKNLDKLINMSNTCKDMSISGIGSGEYHTLNLKIWKQIETGQKTDDRGRIHLNREYSGKDPRVFVADEYQDPETCKSYIILSKSNWEEVRKIRGKEAGEPLEIQSNGDIWTGHKNKFVKVFVKV
jgi:hypothetical protein